MVKSMFRNDVDGQLLEDTYANNEQYEGYCKDLADELSRLTGASFEIRPVKDGRYGSPNLDEPGEYLNIQRKLSSSELR